MEALIFLKKFLVFADVFLIFSVVTLINYREITYLRGYIILFCGLEIIISILLFATAGSFSAIVLLALASLIVSSLGLIHFTTAEDRGITKEPE
jgi:hypothetical protein